MAETPEGTVKATFTPETRDDGAHYALRLEVSRLATAILGLGDGEGPLPADVFAECHRTVAALRAALATADARLTEARRQLTDSILTPDMIRQLQAECDKAWETSERVADMLGEAKEAIAKVRPPTPDADNPLYYPLLFLITAIEEEHRWFDDEPAARAALSGDASGPATPELEGHVVHTHGSEDGPGLTCREYRVGDRLYGECQLKEMEGAQRDVERWRAAAGEIHAAVRKAIDTALSPELKIEADPQVPGDEMWAKIGGRVVAKAKIRDSGSATGETNG